MKIYKRLIMSLAIGLCLIDVVLVFSGINRIDVYFLANAAVYFVITLLYSYPHPKPNSNLNAVSAAIFVGLLATVAETVVGSLR